MTDLSPFSSHMNICLIGSTGGIGQAFARNLQGHTVYEFSRSKNGFDLNDEDSIEQAAATIPDQHINLIIIATGVLGNMPEKALKDLTAEQLTNYFQINTIGPALIMKHFAPKLARDRKAILAALSARVGSIGDNNLGGWYGYRSSKAALNMMIKCTAIELSRTHNDVAVIGLHPGTVDTGLSKSFQSHVPDGKLFTPDYAAKQMLNVLHTITKKDTGKVFDYAGKQIEW